MSAPLSAESVIFPTMAPTPSSTDMGEDLVGEGKAWGLSTSVDLQDCHPDTIRDPNHIRAYVVALCELIGMKRYGDCQIVHFGDGRVAGYSMVQLIETSLISGHFANDTNRAYLDIFSRGLFQAILWGADQYEFDDVSLLNRTHSYETDFCPRVFPLPPSEIRCGGGGRSRGGLSVRSERTARRAISNDDRGWDMCRE
jgi:S-adenosylmethionine/arginine decarboxylase-like enzyme